MQHIFKQVKKIIPKISDTELIALRSGTTCIDKDIFLGDFIKALLKINNIVKEMEKIGGLLNNIELVEKLKKIEENTLKFVVSNQSLYI